jgi:cytidylate kinase|tara:strand:- start:587 stop:850 length:264 start_codon:yes stop_codon:yes gene_type:complete
MTEEQLAQLGIDAEVLLNTEAFNRTINVLVDASVQEFLGTASAEADKREVAYSHYKALADIVNTLKQQVEVRDQIDSKQQEETIEEE